MTDYSKLEVRAMANDTPSDPALTTGRKPSEPETQGLPRKIAVCDVGGPGEPLKKVDTYDLLNPQDFKAFADKHGEALARTLRFGLAYGINRKTTLRTFMEQDYGRNKDALDEFAKIDFAALEAAYGKGDKR